jgi:ABC-type polysaccharide/polyol phosphate transport system ATPase subunit
MPNINIKDLCVDFPIFNAHSLSIRNVIIDKLRGRKGNKKSSHKTVRALDQINFEVKAGDRIGLIGHNGSGKSTLLRALAGIYHPTAGSISMTGTVSTLFGTAFGVNEEMTGYENLFLNSLIFSRDYKKTSAQMEEMAEFTELGEHLNFPVRTYSAGMKVRVGFASATNMAPEILLIDEVFGMGDKNFQAKTQKRMVNLIDNTSILFLASHSNALIAQFCNKALHLSHGKVVDFGNVDDVIKSYESYESPRQIYS